MSEKKERKIKDSSVLDLVKICLAITFITNHEIIDM